MWHAVEAAILDEEVQKEETNEDNKVPEPSSKHKKSNKGKNQATKGKRHCKMSYNALDIMYTLYYSDQLFLYIFRAFDSITNWDKEFH